MEFPKSAFCNVHRIDGISCIQWSIYRLDRDAQAIANGLATLREELSFDTEQTSDRLMVPERELRDRGYHVCLDRNEAALWIFDLSCSVVKDETKHEEMSEAAGLLEIHDCKRQSFGTVQALELENSLVHSGSNLSGGNTLSKNVELSNSDAFQANKSVNLLKTETGSQFQDKREATVGDLEKSKNISMIYEKIVIALSMSILYVLTKEFQCVPSNSDTFLLSTNNHLDVLCDFKHSQQGYACMTAITLLVQWQPTRTLVISSYPKQTLQWRSIADAFHRREALDLSTMGNLILAPLGIPVRFAITNCRTPESPSDVDPDDSSDSQKSSETPHLHDSQEWKACVRSLLESYGGAVPYSTRWLRVEALHPKSSDENFLSEFLWPDYLCFYCIDDSKSLMENFSCTWDNGDQNGIDSLAHAENWFLGQSTRDKLLETFRKQAEHKTSSKANAGGSDDEDSGSDIFISTRRAIDEQALSGIYPTPPDGYRSSAISALPVAEKDAIDHSHAKEPSSSASEEKQFLGQERQMPHISPQNDIGLGDFEHLEEDDLFGDMNTDMFTANGITEADFSFFDEPSPAKELSQEDYHTILSEQSRPSYPSKNPDDLDGGSPNIEDIDMLSQVSDTKEDPGVDMNDYLEELDDMQLTEDSHIPGVLSPLNSPDAPSKQKYNTAAYNLSGEPTTRSSPIPNQSAGWKWLQPQSRLTQFGCLSFEDWLTAFDTKYVADGRFGVDTICERTGNEPTESFSIDNELPTLRLLARHEVGDLDDDEDDSDQVSLPEIGDRLLLEEHSKQQDKSSSISFKRKRKRETSDVDDSKLIISQPLLEYKRDGDTETDHHFLDQLIAKSSVGSFSDPKHVIQRIEGSLIDLYSNNAQSFVQLAQIVSEQLAAETHLLSEYSLFMKDESISPSYQNLSRYNDPLGFILPKIFPCNERCDFTAYASLAYTIGSNSLMTTSHPPLWKQDSSTESQGQGKAHRLIFEIACPNVLARRGDTLMEISAVALPYWEELGLGPYAGSKDVSALCIFPESQMTQRGAKNFLRSVSGTYQSLRLGSHASYSKIGSFSDGLVPVQLIGSSVEEHIRCIDQLCEKLGGMLARESDIGKPIIVYMVNPFADPTALPLLCNSYIKMLAAYASKAGYHTYSYVYDILLKVIPITMIASKTTIPIQTPQVYAQIARETYERCSIQTSEQLGSPTCFSSIFQLARTVPKSVNFGLTSDPPKILVGEDSSYHVAYSWCFDLQWLSVLLIDTQGNLCWKASYCLGVCPSDVTFQETAKDVWDRILDTVSTRISSPRLVLVKDQAMKPIELKTWISLAATASSTPINLIVATVDCAPPLFFTGLPTTSSQPTNDGTNYTTPATTPLTSSYDVGSPVVSGGWASTAPKAAECFEVDPSARLVDKLDETWGMITSCSVKRDDVLRQAPLAEGYLIKRAGVRDDEGMDMIGVQILHAEKMNERVLSDVLVMFRALATLGRVKAVADNCNGILPWHIAVVRKIQKGLNRLMPWGK